MMLVMQEDYGVGRRMVDQERCPDLQTHLSLEWRTALGAPDGLQVGIRERS